MLKLDNVSKYYYNQNVVALGLRKVSLDFHIGEFVALTGESGSGKSTLLNVISGMDTYEEGELYINGEETSYYDQSNWEEYRKHSVGFVFQNYNLIDSYTVLENVEAALIIQNQPKKERIRRAKDIIDKVGLTPRLRHKASKLSGGEKQRLSIARALAKDTKLIVADEPTGNLDSKSGEMVLALLHEISKDKLVIIVTHNYDQAAPYVTRKIRLFDGEVVEDKSIQSVALEEEVEKIVVTQEDTFVQHHKKSLTFALYNLKSQPKKTILMLMVTFATVFFVFAIYSAYVIISSELRGESFDPFGGSSTHTYAERVIVTKPVDENGQRVGLTASDRTFFASLSEVLYVFEYDALFDANITLELFDGSDSFLNIDQVYLADSRLLTGQKLIAGRLPETSSEVVLTSAFLEARDVRQYEIDKWLDNDPINILINLKAFNGLANTTFSNYKIVGIVENLESRFMYADQSFADIAWYRIKDYRNPMQLSVEMNQSKWSVDSVILRSDTRLTGNQMVFSADYKYYLEEYYEGANFYLGEHKMEIITSIEQPIDRYRTMLVSPAFYTANTTEDLYQYSLHIVDAQSVPIALTKLSNQGYFAFNPATSGGRTIFDDFILIPIIFFSIFAFFVLFMIYLFSYLIIRTIMMSKKKDYTILRTIGTDMKQIRAITRYEIVISFIGAFVLLMILVFGLSFSINPFINQLLYAFVLLDYVTLFFFNILISVLIAMRYNRKMVNQSIFTSLKAGE